MTKPPRRRRPTAPCVSLARALSKLGACSRTEAARWIAAGRVEVDGRPARDAALRVDPARARIRVDGAPLHAAERVYLMMNKPRGLVTTRDDPEGRATVYALLRELTLPWVAPVGRLDRASEGLLLFTNDTRWAESLMAPGRHVPRTYHVQVAGRPNEEALRRMRDGVEDAGERLAAGAVRVFRAGARNCWLEVVLDEGRNRQVRRLLAALGFETLRLVRVAIGRLELGELGKGEVRRLEPDERRLAQSAAERPGRARRHRGS